MKNYSNKGLIKVITEDIGSDPFLLNKFLIDLLTTSEYTEIKKRWEIVKMLDKGISQHLIVKTLNVGIATVTRGSKVLKNPNGGFSKILNKIHK